ncbi:Zinc carboxypeptidase [Halovenus aranensis]|uniref:Zinc carboxypeptidase n=1 Tax=Halovenus aranensis TaxID=890420 RepID=A0A1G8S614_9EURY|nr:M14 family metallopeptidase [Halovenus aranensis]SDJ24669.1 Zinc carboxypeptidase [Halovenus aranensis]
MDTRPSITRREFAALSAGAVGTALGADAATGRSVSAAESTARYEFLVNNIESDHTIPTLLTVADGSAADVLDGRGTSVRTREDDQVAYAKLTTAEATAVIDADATERIEYAPGSNPFWKREAYDDGVFLDPVDSVDFIGLEEALTGLSHLEQRHENRLNLRSIGTGAGHDNVYIEQEDPREVWALELTENVGDREAVTEKATLVFTLSVHGDERAGIEAGLRFVEEVVSGERPDIEALLSEVVLVFVSPNPGGWVVRQPLYEDPAQPPDFRRFNAAGLDPNRQYPSAGWLPPDTVPGEPNGRNLTDDGDGLDEDVPDETAEKTPDTAAVVDYLRSHDNVEYVLDFHGMYADSSAVVALTPPGGTPADRADVALLTRALESDITSALGSVSELEPVFEAAIDNYETQGACRVERFCEPPERLFDHGSALDMFGYTAAGAVDRWAMTPESNGGLGATALTLEIVFSNSFPREMRVPFLPSVTQFHVDAYQTAIATTVEYAENTSSGTVATNERTTAYVQSESVARSSADLPHVGGSETVASGVGTSSPVGGEYRHRTHVFGGSADLDTGTVSLTASQTPPNPESVFGYQQRRYEVTPLAVFDTLADAADASVDGVRIDAIRDGALVVDGTPTYDNLVVCHNDGLDEAYRSALTEYVDAGGNLVLTDAGVAVAAELDVPGIDAVEDGDVTREERRAPWYGEPPEEDHPLCIDRKGLGEEGTLTGDPWDYPMVGYVRGQPPSYTVSESALGDSVRIASRQNGDVQAATVPVEGERIGVHLLGTLLPPAEQGNLHPFGLLDQSLTTFGYTLLCNALGYRLNCSLNGETVTGFGETVTRKLAEQPEPTPTPTATPTATETETSTATPAPSPTPTGADGDGPGFGPLAAVSGVTSYLLGRRLTGDDSTEE